MAVHERSPSHKANPKDPEELELLDAAIVALRMAIMSEVEPASIPSDNDAGRIFTNLCAVQIEYCRSIRQLVIDGHVLAAAAVLRTILEVTTGFSWASINFQRRKEHYLQGRPFGGIKNMMDELAWADYYERLYRPLCAFTHASYSVTEMQRALVDVSTLNEEDIDRALMFFPQLSEEGGITKIIVDLDLTPDELLKRHGLELSFHAFDFVIVMLMRGAGEYADSSFWWPRRNELMKHWDRYAAVFHKRMPMLWYKERERLIVYKREGWFQFDPSSV